MLAFAAVAGSSPAFAEWSKTEHGAKAWTEANYRIMNVRDIEADGNPVKAEYHRNAHPSTKLTLWNKGGVDGPPDNDGNPGTVESGKHSRIFKAQVCEERDKLPDFCSGWYSF
ncbi:hypothetical protein DY218_31300 [Streptomyces triticagri]|uniref:Uncharacterized protein n=1 Tax=Streptomyces triticagri TaxID=2293568 RepID=A0A372LVP7_9ACTN|nr:hypothetical protein [Streptomyces triticagri]RFU82746.1 hypothetical protein DY218_31300 [Streptomyces triticagri]